MKAFNSEEDKAELLQPAWLWSIVSMFAALGLLCMEILKTVIWLPWALYELMRGHLGPHVRNGLLVGMVGMCFLGGQLYFISNMLLYDPNTAPHWNVFFYTGVAIVYIVVGVTVRSGTKPYDLLK